MYCIYCGKYIPDDGAFCSYCGRKAVDGKLIEEVADDDSAFALSDAEYTKPEIMPVRDTINFEVLNNKESNRTEEEAPNEESLEQQAGKTKRRYTDKRIWIIAAALAVLIIGTIFAITGGLKLNNRNAAVYTLRSGNELDMITNTDKALLIDTSGRKLHTFDFPAIPFFCGDNTSAVLYDYDKRLFTHYVDARKLLELRREANIAAITKDGRYIYYIVNNEDGSTLYSCNVKGMKEKMLAASPGRKMSKLVVSPDGKTVAYSVNPVSLNGHYSYYNEETESFIIYDGKEPVYFGTGRVIEQISDDGKYIYYVEASPVSSELQLYVECAEGSTLLTEDWINSTLLYNRDLSELIISGNNGTFISISGGEPSLIMDNSVLMILLPQNCRTQNIAVFDKKEYDVSTFLKTVLLCSDNTLKLINEDYIVKDIGNLAPVEMVFNARGEKDIMIGKMVMSGDGNEIIYISSENELVKVSGILRGEPEYKVLSMLADDFAVSDDLKHIYFSWNNELFYINNKGEGIFIDDSITDLVSSTDATAVFYRKKPQLRHGPLYCSSEGSPARRVTEIIEVSEISKNDRALMFFMYSASKAYMYYNPKGVDIIPLFSDLNVGN